MKTLSTNWLTEGHIDYEYKKYLLLAYLQDVKKHFAEKRLYPILSDLIFHYQNLIILKKNKNLIKEAFPERLTITDFQNLKNVYEKIVNDDSMMNEIEDILSFSIPEIKSHLAEGKDMYEYFESKMNISPVGIMPLYPDEGYLFVSENEANLIRIYEYQFSIFQSTNDKYRGIHIHFIEAQRRGFANTFENMKIDLTKRYKKLPNPAAYLVESKIEMPLDESLLPIAKRLLVKYISTTS